VTARRGNPKHQIPNSKQIQNPKFQTARPGASVSVIGALNLEFVWDLELGIWDL
jgi:hypothetical protein